MWCLEGMWIGKMMPMYDASALAAFVRQESPLRRNGPGGCRKKELNV